MIRPRTAVRLGFGVGVLALVLVALDPAQVIRALSSADLLLVALGVLGLTAMHAINAAGWRWMVAQRSGVRLPWGAALRIHYAAQALGSVTPANLGSDVHRAAALRQAGLGWAAAVEPVVAQRATSYAALSVLAAAGLVVVSSANELSRLIVLIGGAVAVVLLAASWLLLMPFGPFRGIHARLQRLVEGKETPSGGPDLDRSFRRTWPMLVAGVSTGLIFHGGSVALTWLLVMAMDPSGPAWPMLGAIAVARLSLAVPLSPNGLGVQEGTLAALVAAMNLDPQPALAAMLLARLSTVMLAAVGVSLLISRRSSMPRAQGVSLSSAGRR